MVETYLEAWKKLSKFRRRAALHDRMQSSLQAKAKA